MKNYIFIIAFLLFNITAFAQVNKLLRQADRATDLNEKIDLYTEVIALDSKNLDAYFYRGLAKNNLGDYSGAIVDYSRVLVLQPDPDTYYNRGNSRYNLKNFVGALDDYEAAYKLDPNFIDALYSLGCVKFDLGSYEEAIKDLTKVINAVPTEPKTYFIRAAAYNALQKYPSALNDYTLAILADPSTDAYYNRGAFFLSINYFEKANFDFSMAIKLNDNNAFAYFYRGTSFLFLGKYDEAILDFNKSLSYDSLDFDALLGLSLTYYKMSDLNNSKLYYQKAKAIVVPATQVVTVNDFRNTYWFQNQSFFFNENFANISKL